MILQVSSIHAFDILYLAGLESPPHIQLSKYVFLITHSLLLYRKQLSCRKKGVVWGFYFTPAGVLKTGK